ncbi:pancreatic alpha-amylase-like [Nannospalax galili]|uniref:pancreatic alpha-amylase-like n=1 Tax=Nannospalax galili TaxID=1026970 RepID=UPI00111C65A3|nr:pancreatic alpha-amylase-like [Nannospalax galili]
MHFLNRNWGEGWGMVPTDRALVFVDNHDNQRGHGAGGASILTFWDARMYKIAVGFMLAHPYGFTRVMSSYRWDRRFVNGKDVNDWIGPPNNNGAIKEVTINADSTCGNGGEGEHRWRQIRNMVAFRNVVNGQPFANWWDNGSNQVAFGRGNKGFIVFNNDDWSLSAKLQTGLPAGTYCDVISGDKSNGSCTGIKVQVSGDGTAQFSISNSAEDPFIAIHSCFCLELAAHCKHRFPHQTPQGSAFCNILPFLLQLWLHIPSFMKCLLRSVSQELQLSIHIVASGTLNGSGRFHDLLILPDAY